MRVLQALITTTIVECVSDHMLNKLDIGGGGNGTFQHEEPLFENRPLLFYVINMLMSPCVKPLLCSTSLSKMSRKERR